MKLTYPLLLSTKPQDKPYKIRDRDSTYLRVSVPGSKAWIALPQPCSSHRPIHGDEHSAATRR